jgi:hypothetical protein
MVIVRIRSRKFHKFKQALFKLTYDSNFPKHDFVWKNLKLKLKFEFIKAFLNLDAKD